MKDRYIALYGRQSLYKEDSISVETQIEYCKYETHGEPYRIYIDKGYSGKDTNRPAFEEMLRDIEKKAISSVVVYKLDRISRSILDFSNLMEVFQKYEVEFISTTEKFDTSTPIGRAMLNICIVFAQLERETIQKRIVDAYYARSKKGLYMGGRVPYGFRLEKTIIDGIHTSKYVPIVEEAEQIRLLYSLYAETGTSLGAIIRYFKENQIENLRGVPWNTARLSELIRNPVYVKADAEVYNFFKNQGANIINPIEDFAGQNACYLYRGTKDERNKLSNLTDKDLVLAPHEGLITSKVWLKCRRKCLDNRQSTTSLKAKNSWLIGKVKCGNCGYALTIAKANTRWGRYFVCSNRLNSKACEGVGMTIYADMLEQYIFTAIEKKLKDINVLTTVDEPVINHSLNERKIQLCRLEAEIEELVGKINNANEILMKYINEKIEVLDTKRTELKKTINTINNLDGDNIQIIVNPAAKWGELSFADRQAVVATLISVIYVSENQIDITWKA